ncbi:MAG: hypothetical protein ACRDO2_13500 [Nocardioidaceae bacterium]
MAFQAASLELAAALTAMSEADLTTVGTPASDVHVAAGLADLRTALERLQATADACVRGTGRHLSEAATTEPMTPGGAGAGRHDGPDTILGFDPLPGDPTALASLPDVLRRSIRALVEARTGLDRLGRTGSVLDGPAGAPIATLLRTYSRRISALEQALLDCMHAVDHWRDGLDHRQGQVADIVSVVADLAGRPEVQDRRTRLIASAREIGAEHDRAARDLAGAFEDLSSLLAELPGRDDDLAADLDRALLALATPVDDWIEAEGPELIRTAIALGEVAGLTTVISELVGIAALGRNPGDAEGVGEIIARSPGSHRLIRALRRQWQEVAPEALPSATFAVSRVPGIGGRLDGATLDGDPHGRAAAHPQPRPRPRGPGSG